MKKVNKSAWIRSQPTSVPAKEVVAKAKSEGITLSVAQVYTARNTMTKVKKEATPARAAQSPAVARAPVDSELNEFRRYVIKIGVVSAERMLSQLKREFGL